jgi:hypothetical protein
MINLKSAFRPFDLSRLPNLPELREHRVYTTRVSIGGRMCHHLRLGDFPSEEAARVALEGVREVFPDARVSELLLPTWEDPSGPAAVDRQAGEGGGGGSAPEERMRGDPSARPAYAINLASAVRSFAATDRPSWEAPEGYRIYTTRVLRDGRTWHRLRLGLFPSKKAALELLKTLPGHGVSSTAWVARVSPREASEFGQEPSRSPTGSDHGERSSPSATPPPDAGGAPPPERWRKTAVSSR